MECPVIVRFPAQGRTNITCFDVKQPNDAVQVHCSQTPAVRTEGDRVHEGCFETTRWRVGSVAHAGDQFATCRVPDLNPTSAVPRGSLLNRKVLPVWTQSELRAGGGVSGQFRTGGDIPHSYGVAILSRDVTSVSAEDEPGEP